MDKERGGDIAVSRIWRGEPMAGAERQGAAQTAELPGRVLLVDDQPELRRLFQRTLSRVGHTVTTAENGRKAVALVVRARLVG